MQSMEEGQLRLFRRLQPRRPNPQSCPESRGCPSTSLRLVPLPDPGRKAALIPTGTGG